MPFQKAVYLDPAPAIEGDFASADPRSSMLVGAAALTAGQDATGVGPLIGRFGRARNDTGVVTNAHPGVPCRTAFIHRWQTSVITAWLGASSLSIAPGAETTMFDTGAFWCRFVAGATIGQKAFASYADGSAIAGAAGGTVAGASTTANTTSGSATITVTNVASGVLAAGQPVTGAGIPTGTTIAALGTGTGGAGTYTLSAPATATATGVAVTSAGAQETMFFVHSNAAAGELAKISQRLITS